VGPKLSQIRRPFDRRRVRPVLAWANSLFAGLRSGRGRKGNNCVGLLGEDSSLARNAIAGKAVWRLYPWVLHMPMSMSVRASLDRVCSSNCTLLALRLYCAKLAMRAYVWVRRHSWRLRPRTRGTLPWRR